MVQAAASSHISHAADRAVLTCSVRLTKLESKQEHVLGRRALLGSQLLAACSSTPALMQPTSAELCVGMRDRERQQWRAVAPFHHPTRAPRQDRSESNHVHHCTIKPSNASSIAPQQVSLFSACSGS